MTDEALELLLTALEECIEADDHARVQDCLDEIRKYVEELHGRVKLTAETAYQHATLPGRTESFEEYWARRKR